MDSLRAATDPTDVRERTSTGRRSFVWRVGAGMSAVLASAVPSLAGRRVDRPGLPEDELAIRRLHETFEACLDNGLYEDVVGLFADDGQVIFNGGVFEGRARGVRRLYVERFGPSRAGRRIDVPPGIQSGEWRKPAEVTVTGDGRSAAAKFPFSIEVGTPIVPDSPLARMARLHGERTRRWWEGGTYEVSSVKDGRDGRWRIGRLEYRVLSRADRSRARPVPAAFFSRVFPEDPAGPDRLLGQAERLRIQEHAGRS